MDNQPTDTLLEVQDAVSEQTVEAIGGEDDVSME
jgi:hypothetical protein